MARRPFPIGRIVLVLAPLAAGCASPGEPPSPAAADPAAPPGTLLDVTAPAAARAGASDAATPVDSDTSRPGRLLIYSAITGHVPLDGAAPAADDRHKTPAEREAARAASIEAEIEEELARQEQLDVEEPPRPPKIATCPQGCSRRSW
jgi:hypothetical protein